mmetsp:Transcript_80349/g.239331  ORF Transcript_80349/g.239331 Transcript_80349/m.239331 type:complete len:469 (+) Transcript_80349:67-1473(+)
MGSEAAPPAPRGKAPWPPLMGLWKSRLPAIVVPVLAGLRSRVHSREGLRSTYPCLEVALLAAIAGTTGYARLPFSVTWWLVLLAAFTLETELLLGAAACLSLSVLLGWYGVRLNHPQAISALWGGNGRHSAPAAPVAGTGSSLPRVCWQAWDVFVHGLPAVMVLYWHGPSVRWDGTVVPGTATLLAVAATLPMNILWIWGLGLGLPGREGDGCPSRTRLWPRGMRLADTNCVYRVAPELPERAWRWIYGSHWAACSIWLSCLVLPKQVIIAFGIFAVFGLRRLPYTTAWWTLFLLSLYGGSDYPMLRGVCACCAVTTATGFYGTQILLPYAFMSLVRVWVVLPVQRLGPRWFAEPLVKASETWAFEVAARLADLCIHLLPTTVAVRIFRDGVTSGAALAALPTNLIYLASTGSSTLAETNKIYGVVPPPPLSIWRFIYGSHWLICSAILFICLVADALAAARVPAIAQ